LSEKFPPFWILMAEIAAQKGDPLPKWNLRQISAAVGGDLRILHRLWGAKPTLGRFEEFHLHRPTGSPTIGSSTDPIRLPILPTFCLKSTSSP
jgi:hypothetical protein